MIFSRADILRAINDPCYKAENGKPTAFAVGGERMLEWVTADNGMVVAYAGANVALEIRGMIVEVGAPTATPADLFTGINIRRVTLGLWNKLNPLEVSPGEIRFSYLQQDQANDDGEARSKMISATTPVSTLNIAGRLVSNKIRTWTPTPISFVDPVVLWGDDPQGIARFGVMPQNTNHLAVSFFGREWPFDTSKY